MAASLPRTFIEIARGGDELAERIAEWDELSGHAIEPNVFFESGAFLAALRHFPRPGPLCCVFVYQAGATGGASDRRLIAFAPFVRVGKGPRDRIPSYRLFTHLHCYLSTPLIHREHVDAALDSLLAWMDGAPDGVRVFGLYNITGDGSLAQSLRGRLAARGQPNFTESEHERALLRVEGGADAYLARGLPVRKRKELGRQRRRLEELGRIAVAETGPEDAAGPWFDRFLELEASGWKGQRGGWAFSRTPEGRGFFLAFMEHFQARGRALLLALHLDGREIAMKCNLLAADGRGSFAFKIAHDEAFARYSPGVLLEVDNIRRLHEPARGIAWMDSCADPDHLMIDHLWRERRRIVYVMCCSRGLIGRTLLALFQWRNRRGKRAERPA